MKSREGTIDAIAEAREILESVGECCPVYVGFEKSEYTLTRDQIQKIAKALYLADCELFEDLKNEQPL